MEYDVITSEQKARILELSIRALDGEISPADAAELERYISSSKPMAAFYAACIKTHLSMIELKSSPMSTQKSEKTAMGKEFWEMMALQEKFAPAIEIPVEKPPFELIQKVEKPKVVYKVNKFSLYTAVALSAAAMLLVAFVLLFPKPSPIVAYVDEQVGAEWSVKFGSLEAGSDLNMGFYKLKKGFVRIKFNAGSEVLLQGPADFELVADDQMILYDGTLSAMVPEQARGFIVQTPMASVVDYGTEFGVSIDQASGRMETHVFKGLVELRDSSDPARFNTSQKLQAGLAASVNNGVIGKIFKSAPERFVKQMPSDYEMAIRNSNPLCYWRFSDSLTNIIGNERFTARIEGEIGYANVMSNTGQKLKVLSLDPYKAADAGINYGNILNPGRDSFTVSMWFKPFSPEGERRQFMATKRSPNGNIGWSILSIDNDIMFRTGSRAGETAWIGKKDALTTDWHHVVMVIDRQTNKLRGYLDGSGEGWEVQRKEDYFRCPAKIATDAYQIGTNIEGDEDFTIGRNPATSPADILAESEGVTSTGFHGLIYDVAVWQRVLSEREIRRLYNQCPLFRDKY